MPIMLLLSFIEYAIDKEKCNKFEWKHVHMALWILDIPIPTMYTTHCYIFEMWK